MALARNWLGKIISNAGVRVTTAVLQIYSIGLTIHLLAPAEFAVLNMFFLATLIAQPLASLGCNLIAQRDIASLPDEGAEAARISVTRRLFRLQLSLYVLFALVTAVAVLPVAVGLIAPIDLFWLGVFYFLVQTVQFSLEEFSFSVLQALNYVRRSLLFGGLLRTVLLAFALTGVKFLGADNLDAIVLANICALAATAVASALAVQFTLRGLARGHSAHPAFGPDFGFEGQDAPTSALLRYGASIAATRLVAQLRNSVEGFITASFFGLETSGTIAAFRRLSGGVLSLVESLNLMTGSFVANLWQRDPERLQRIIFSVALLGSMIAAGAFAFVALVGYGLFSGIYGESYADHTVYLLLMLGLVFVQVSFGNARRAFAVRGQADRVLRLEIVYTVVYWVAALAGGLAQMPVAVIVAFSAVATLQSMHLAAMARKHIDLRSDIYLPGQWAALLREIASRLG